MQTKPGETLNYSRLGQDINELKAIYNQHGFQKVQIKYKIEMDKTNNTAIVKILIEEKQRIRIKKIYTEGNEHVSQKTILGMMKTKPAWLLSLARCTI